MYIEIGKIYIYKEMKLRLDGRGTKQYRCFGSFMNIGTYKKLSFIGK